MPSRLGVGFIGAGPVTQAIHLPTLARLKDTFRVVHVADIDPDVAASVAGRVGARSSSSLDELLDDTEVDVVAVCSPHQFHAVQVATACEAGKRAVLCEKPFAMSADEAHVTATVSTRTGVPVVVGAMHTFDPGWLSVSEHWGSLPQDAHTIRSSIVLPPNSRFEDFATEVITRPTFAVPDLSDPDVAAALVHGGVMGLAIHDLPLVRALLPHSDDLMVHSAHALAPFGYQIILTAAGRRVVLHAAISTTWRPEWTFEAWSNTDALRVEFTPSFVHAGSAVGTLTTASSSRTWGPALHNGYEGEWRRIAAVARGETAPPSLDELVQDLRFALEVASTAADAVRAYNRGDVFA